jgi:mRNA interferase RelE/StbE
VARKIGVACVEFVFGPLASNSDRLGVSLTGQLAGLRSARHGSYRIIDRIDDQAQRIDTTDIGHRGDAYR